MDYLKEIRNGNALSLKDSISMIIHLSIPVIVAQISSIVMQYIDASMVGHLATSASASIGLVSTSTWLLAGILRSIAVGYNVQVAHKIGAKENTKARNIVLYGMGTALIISLVLLLLAGGISGILPSLLGGSSDIAKDASSYFLVFALSLPLLAINFTAGGMLQSSGNMKIPSILNIIMCILDVIFNFFLIFPTREILIFNQSFLIFGFGLGVMGAALGTLLAEVVIAGFMLYFLFVKSEVLSFRKEPFEVNYWKILKQALFIAVPLGLESVAMSSAYITTTRIVAPLGNSSIAAHSFAITAESLCYMPGYGIGAAATTIIGQCVGARQFNTAKRLGIITTIFGIVFMGFTGILMYIFAPLMIGLLTPAKDVITLGAMILRIEAFAEPMYAASIVISGVFRGYGDTLIPGIMNLASMWLVRIPLSYLFVVKYGLRGVWIAMSIELVIRGIIFIVRLLLKNNEKLMQTV